MSELKHTNQYKQCYCAFVDFLGFSDAVVSGSLTPDEIISAMRKAAAVSQGNEDMVSVTQFSDSLILSCPAEEDWSFLTLVSLIFYLNIELVQHGILIRGGISKGDLYHVGSVAFGPAFLRAYKLEQSASTPRVIIDAEIAEHARWPDSMTFSERKKFLNECLPNDTDGWRYVDYLSARHTGEFDAGEDGLESHYESLSDLVKKNKNSLSPSIRTKYGWLENKLFSARKQKI